jgi:OmpA-OmpF porin, OOP family
MRGQASGILLPFILLSNFSIAQNLVPNPGFEESSQCPGGFSQAAHEFQATSWTTANTGTPDHFHACSNGEADVPYNWAGVSEAFEGNGYAGIFLWMGIKSYREYLQCRLLEPLIKDSTYSIAFRYKLSSYSKYSIDRIGMLVHDSLVREKHDYVLSRNPTLSVVQDSALTRKTGLWESASMNYKARGGERFVTIGNFAGDETTGYYKIISRPISEEMLASASYYYIDDVKVIPAYILAQADSLNKLPRFVLGETELNKTYVLNDIRFAFNSYRLLPPSFQELDQVAQFLLDYPRIRVQLFGHTDDQGSEKYNVKLSQERAKNVGEYLKSMGIDAGRIESFGYGKSKPLIDDTSEEARAVNRRVEVKFIR